MIHPRLRRLIGLILILVALTGLFFALFGLVKVSQLRTTLVSQVETAITLTDETLDNTVDGLVLVSESLNNTVNSLAALEATTGTMVNSIDDTNNLLASAADVIGEDIPTAIDSAILSLSSAQSAARVIDDYLRILSAIPFISSERYNPNPPLNVAIQNVADNLADINPSLLATEENLQLTRDNLIGLEENLATLKDEIGLIKDNVDAMQGVIDNYQETLEKTRTLVDNTGAAAAGWISGGSIGLMVFFVWFALAQLAPLFQGLHLLKQ
jgi:hypothetical protein